MKYSMHKLEKNACHFGYHEHIGDTFGWKDRQKTNEYSVDTSLEWMVGSCQRATAAVPQIVVVLDF